jgi:multidrug efflux pump subunit AcrA (membrane-fusion protein)
LTSAQTAALKVAENQMQDVRQGMPVALELRNHKELVAGNVTAVHAEVANRTITVDVAIDGALPPGVNVAEPVDAIITAGALTNVVHVGRPVFAQSNGRLMLFRLEPDGHTAKKAPVQFGSASVNVIEIKSGLRPGDKVILNDMSKYDGVAAIVLR